MFWYLLLLYIVVYFAGQSVAWIVNHLLLKALLPYRKTGLICVAIVAGLAGFLLFPVMPADISPFVCGQIEGRFAADVFLPAIIIMGCVGYRAANERKKAADRKKSGIIS